MSDVALLCDICGKHAKRVCKNCGKRVCDEHYNTKSGLCASCMQGRA